MEWGNQDGEQFGTNHSSGIQCSSLERDVGNSKGNLHLASAAYMIVSWVLLSCHK